MDPFSSLHIRLTAASYRSATLKQGVRAGRKKKKDKRKEKKTEVLWVNGAFINGIKQ